jgi:hypothetical protein
MMVRLIFRAVVVLCFMASMPGLSNVAQARDERLSDSASPVSTISAEDIERIVDQRVDQRVQDILNQQRQAPPTFAAPPTRRPGEPVKETLGGLSQPRTPDKKYGSTMQGSGNLIYARPFVSSPKAIVGGYMDIEYINRKNQGNSRFDQHRLVPFIYGDISDRVKFAAEIEIEHGEELKVEFATIDYLIQEPINLRAGIILVPLGKFNLLHDSPLRDLTERPLVTQRIIPSTLHQPGIGTYGTFYPTALSKLDYEFYVTNGFTKASGGDGNPNNTSNINQKNGIRSARSSNTEFDNNNGKSIMGRAAFSPILGVEIGGSGFYGNYGTKKNDHLAIWAVDWTFIRGPFEFIGESAWSYIKNNNINQDGTRNGNPRRMHGYYLQANYHFLPEWLSNMAPTFFKQEVSTFTVVARWEQMKLGQDLSGEARKLGEWQRWTFGLNFRPTEDTVFKTDFQYTPVGRNGDERIHDTAFLASLATYF